MPPCVVVFHFRLVLGVTTLRVKPVYRYPMLVFTRPPTGKWCFMILFRPFTGEATGQYPLRLHCNCNGLRAISGSGSSLSEDRERNPKNFPVHNLVNIYVSYTQTETTFIQQVGYKEAKSAKTSTSDVAVTVNRPLHHFKFDKNS